MQGPKYNLNEVLLFSKMNLNEHSERTQYKLVIDKNLKMRTYECNFCKLKLFSLILIKKHLLEYHEYVALKLEKVIHQCSKCVFKTGQIIDLVMHMKNIHNSEELYTRCGICKYKNPHKSKVKDHTTEVHLKIKHTCDQCGYIRRRGRDIRSHKLTAHGGIAYSCDMCNKSNLSRDMLRSHQKLIHKEIFCDKCNFKCLGSQNLREHKMKDHDKKIINCTECDFVSFVGLELNQHMRFTHPKDPYKCLKCEYSSVYKQDLVAHTKMQHNMSRTFKCDKCEYHFDSVRNLQLHKLLEHVLKRNLQNCLARFEAKHPALERTHNLTIKLDPALILKCSKCEHESMNILDLKLHQVSHSAIRKSKELITANLMKVKQTNINRFDKKDVDFKTTDKICRVYPDENRLGKTFLGPLIQFGKVIEQSANSFQDNVLYQLKSKTKCQSQEKFHDENMLKHGNVNVFKKSTELNTPSNCSLPGENKLIVIEDCKYALNIKTEENEEFEEGEVRKSL